jgi:signal peptidase I
MIPWILLLAYLAVLFVCLPKIFAKAGVPAWKGYVPGYNFFIWNRILGKPWYWIILLLVPGINLLMLIIYNVNTSIAFNERTVKQHLIAVLTPWVTLPRLAFKEEHKWVGPIPIGNRKRAFAGQWGDAILFAVIVATAFRTFTFEAFTIPTPSMEKSLLVGDYLFVSKLSYGPRMPMTPITFPFTHHTLPLTKSTPSFTNWFSLPYFRLPGFGKPERGDAVVFNFPEGDTVVADMQNQSYYQLLRQYGREVVWNERNRFETEDESGQRQVIGFGNILVRPTDKQENYIKRCVAVAGDSVEVRDGDLYVNGALSPLPKMGQYAYDIKANGSLSKERLKDDIDVNYEEYGYMAAGRGLALTAEGVERIKAFKNVSSVDRRIKPRGAYTAKDAWPMFPSDPAFNWSEDNFGPLWVPKAGATVQLTMANLPLYRRTISLYEGNTLEVRGSDILINGVKADSYTFKQDYYWMMGDNRHRSQDARYWGFVPFDHVVGKAVMVWLTTDPENGGFPMGIRWKRVFSLVR